MQSKSISRNNETAETQDSKRIAFRVRKEKKKKNGERNRTSSFEEN